MGETKESVSSEAAKPTAAPCPEPVPEEPATLGQKIFIVVRYLYVASLVWLVLSHHWYGVLPNWLDPH